ncbi:MAG: 50S ribosomal protein L4 [Spirosomataceae bacterium]
MEVKVVDKNGKDTGRTVTLHADIFGIEPNNHVIWLDVKQYLANQRQGTHKAKQRAEVNRSTKKILKQKGSGGARHGSRKAPIFVGGGRVFGPTPRDYSFKLNKKVKELARKSALSVRAAEGNILVVEDFSFDVAKTKSYIGFLGNLSLSGVKTILLTPEFNETVYLSSRNIPKTKVTTAAQVSTYEIVNAEKVIISESALPVIESILS